MSRGGDWRYEPRAGLNVSQLFFPLFPADEYPLNAALPFHALPWTNLLMMHHTYRAVGSSFFRLMLVLIISVSALRAAEPTITTIVGGGSGDGQPATASGFPNPLRSAVDSVGNIYFGDIGMRRVYKIEAGTGILRLFAGNGQYGVTDLSSPVAATEACINQPSGIACDAAGNVYISDRGSRPGGAGTTVTGPCRIVKVDVTTGMLSLVAGLTSAGFSGDNGPATLAAFRYPTGITIGPGGEIYICDQGNHCIRKIDGTGTITRVAGTGIPGFSGDTTTGATTAMLNEPNAVAFDTAGNMYISDEANHRIRKVPTVGNITTVAGSNTTGNMGGFFGDGGLATSAQMNKPGDIKVDSSGNLYIADSQNRRLRQVVGTTINTIVGSNNLPYGGNAGGSALDLNLGYFWSVNLLDASGSKLLITDFYSKKLWHIDRSTDDITSIAGGFRPNNVPATSVHPGYLTDVTFDRDGNAYLADYLNHCVLKVSGGMLSVLAGNGLPEVTGDSGPAVDAGVRNPESVVVDGRYLYIAVPARIWRVDLQTGLISAYAGTGTSGNAGDGGPAISATMGAVRGLVVNPTGDLFLVDNTHGTVRKITRSTGIIERIAGNSSGTTSGDGGLALAAGIADVRDLTLLANGDLVIADLTAGLRLITKQTGIITRVGNLTTARGIITDGDGNCYVSSLHRIYRIQKDTWNETEIAGEVANGFSGDGGPAVAAHLDTPHGMAIDAAGNLHVADLINKRIRLIDTTLTPPTNIGGEDHGGGGDGGGGGGGGCGLGSGATTFLLLCSWLIVLRLRRTRQQF